MHFKQANKVNQWTSYFTQVTEFYNLPHRKLGLPPPQVGYPQVSPVPHPHAAGSDHLHSLVQTPTGREFCLVGSCCLSAIHQEVSKSTSLGIIVYYGDNSKRCIQVNTYRLVRQTKCVNINLLYPPLPTQGYSQGRKSGHIPQVSPLLPSCDPSRWHMFPHRCHHRHHWCLTHCPSHPLTVCPGAVSWMTQPHLHFPHHLSRILHCQSLQQGK